MRPGDIVTFYIKEPRNEPQSRLQAGLSRNCEAIATKPSIVFAITPSETDGLPGAASEGSGRFDDCSWFAKYVIVGR